MMLCDNRRVALHMQDGPPLEGKERVKLLIEEPEMSLHPQMLQILAGLLRELRCDGEVEIGVAGARRYAVFETDGSLKWEAITQDVSSNVTGSYEDYYMQWKDQYAYQNYYEPRFTLGVRGRW